MVLASNRTRRWDKRNVVVCDKLPFFHGYASLLVKTSLRRWWNLEKKVRFSRSFNQAHRRAIHVDVLNALGWTENDGGREGRGVV